MAECGEGVRSLTPQEEIEVVDVPSEGRGALEWILEESFEGWYLRHSKSTLRDIEAVRAATSAGAPVGLIMTKRLAEGPGYVYYIAVARPYRRKGVAKLLLDDALSRFEHAGLNEAFAGVEEDNAPSESLFSSAGFTRTNFAEVSHRYGTFHALKMYRAMLVVPGEVLLIKRLGP